MNWYHRGEGRYVEYGSSLAATRAFGIVRSLYDTVYNMNLAHLSRAHKTVFEHLDDAGLRTAVHDLPDLPRPHAARPVGRRACTGGSPRRRSSATRSTARASSSTRTCSTRATPAARPRSACPASATATPAAWAPTSGRARPVRLPALLAAGQRHLLAQGGPDGQVRSIAEADRALERIMHVAGGTEAFLEEHAVIVMSDHSQIAVEDASTSPRCSRTRACSPPATRRRRGRAGGVPVGALGDGLRARRGAPRGARAGAVDVLGEVDGVDLVIGRATDDGAWCAPARRAALRARRRADRPARAALEPARRRGGARARRGRRRG